MKKLIFLLSFVLLTNLNSYEIKPNEVIKTKTLYVEIRSWNRRNFTLTKEEYKKVKDRAEMLDIAIANFLKEIGAENAIEIKMFGVRYYLCATIIYKEKSFN